MRQLLIVTIFFMVCSAYAQIAPDKYFVEFTDKAGTPYTVSHPEQFLSTRSIERRIRQSVMTTEQDLPVNPAYVSAVAGTGVTVLNRIKWFNGVIIYATNPSSLIAISALPFVKRIIKGQAYLKSNTPEENHKFSFENESSIPLQRDEIFPVSPSGTYNYGGAYNQIHMLKGDYLHNLGFQGQERVIALLDAGYLNADSLPVFDSLRANHQILGTRDFVVPGNNVYQEYYHGMSVLSTMGGNLPGKLVGTAPKASYWLFRTEDVTSENYIEEYNWISGAEAADSVGADIINSSLGYNTFDDPKWNHSWSDLTGYTTLVTQGANIAASKGIAVINSAGNEGRKPWRYISFPADGDAVLAVGAVDSLGNYASFSSHGLPESRVKPNVASQGELAFIAAPDSSFLHSTGTSFSSPIMAGLVACLWQSRPDISVAHLFRAIEMSANRFTNPDTLTGNGIPDFSVAFSHLRLPEVNTKTNTHVYPNPFSKDFFIRCFSIGAERVTIVLYDVLGKSILRQTNNLHPGENHIMLNPDINCPSGLYILTLLSTHFTENFHLVKIVK